MAVFPIFDLPVEIRIQVYEELLVSPTPISLGRIIMLGEPSKRAVHGLDPALLLANKRIYNEANYLLYSKNCFCIGLGELQQGHDFAARYTAYYESYRLEAFLSQIRERNSALLKNLRLGFPRFDGILFGGSVGKVALHETSIRILDGIYAKCPNLVRLEMLTESFRVPTEIYVDHPSSISTEMMTSGTAYGIHLINDYFKRMGSLRDVIVRSGEGMLSEDLQSDMRSLGWKVMS